MRDANDGIVKELRTLLGDPAVFIPWPKGVKGTKRKWKHLTAADMTPEFLSKLPRGNIGVALGEVSGGLCAIDLDLEELVEPFLTVNPHLRETLQTHGSRGAVFWVRFSGNYPTHTIKLKTHSGKETGEFRSTGSQSIIWGIHPDTRKSYRFVVKTPVITIELDSLCWPPEIVNPFKDSQCTEETEETEGTEETEELKSSSPRARLFRSSINCIEDAVQVSLPSKKHENNNCLFTLARAIKTLEKKGQTFEPCQLQEVFEQWYVRSEQFLRDGQSKEEYYLEFMNAYQRAKFPLGGRRLSEAWERASSQPLPDEATKFQNPKLRLLIAFLKQLQLMAGDKPFYATSRDCAAFLEQKTHSTAYMWLGALTTMGYIKVVEPGNDHKATRYRYIWSDGPK